MLIVLSNIERCSCLFPVSSSHLNYKQSHLSKINLITKEKLSAVASPFPATMTTADAILGPFVACFFFFPLLILVWFSFYIKNKWFFYYWNYSFVWNVNVTVIWNVVSNQKSFNGCGSCKPKHIYFICCCFRSQTHTGAGRQCGMKMFSGPNWTYTRLHGSMSCCRCLLG